MRIASVTLIILFSVVLAPAQKAAQPREMYKGPCWDHASNQMQMNDCAGDDLKQADADLNATWQQLLQAMKQHGTDPSALVAVERQWLDYRDAQLNAAYPLSPSENPREKYGSMYPMEWAELTALLTRQRTKILQTLMDDFK